ncbi:hypothetical protein [Streptomyces sp. NPDC003247]|uniref:hypothetical protein n=1 Tax=Streptomyces sp. NPDC003247 TaxID=3364677 RepID=UPI0036BB9E19
MNRSSGARLCAAAVLGALSLALVTGCSSGDGKKDKGSKGSGSGSGAAASSSAPAAEALTSAELEKLLLAQGVDKGFTVESGDDTLPKSKSTVQVDDEACAPLAYAMAALPPGETEAGASNTVTEDKLSDATSVEDLTEEDIDDAFSVATTFVGLSSYDGDGAEKALKAVTDGIDACSGGFGITADGEDQKITKVTADQASVAGDGSAAFAAVVDTGSDGPVTFHVEMVRSGSTLATFYPINLTTLVEGGESEVPAVVVEAQVAKLK